MLDQVLACSAIGAPGDGGPGLKGFLARTGADELMIASHIFDQRRGCAPTRSPRPCGIPSIHDLEAHQARQVGRLGRIHALPPRGARCRPGGP